MDRFSRFEMVIDRFMPMEGEGNTKASQIATAVNKLVYKWFNDGDVYDNNYGLEGWANDLSSYANWLDQNTNAGDILCEIFDIGGSESDYEDILYGLADRLLDAEDLENLEKEEKTGSIYKCDGAYSFTEYSEDDEEEW